MKNYESHELNEMVFARDLKVNDQFIFTLDIRDPAASIKIYDRKTLELLGKFGVLGKGPGELLNPADLTYSSFNNILWLNSQPPGTIFGVKIDPSAVQNSQLLLGCKLPDGLIDGVIFNSDTTYLVSYTDEKQSHVLQFSCDGTNKKVIAKNIENQEIKDPFVRLIFYSRSSAYDSEQNYLFSAFWNHDIITRTNIVTGDVLKYCLPKGRFSKLKKDTSDPNFAVDQWLSFSRIQCKNGLIFASYRGNKKRRDAHTPNKILVYDYELNPIKLLVFDNPVSGFDITEDGLLYILNPENPGSFQIYDLKGIL